MISNRFFSEQKEREKNTANKLPGAKNASVIGFAKSPPLKIDDNSDTITLLPPITPNNKYKITFKKSRFFSEKQQMVR